MAKQTRKPAPAAPDKTPDKGQVRDTLPGLTVRHYCQGLGDCHLLTFRRESGDPFRILIDCGVHASVRGGSALMGEIVDDLKAATGGRIDVVVVTHEHWDHVSGFWTAAGAFADIQVGEVWMGWTENPEDADAIRLDRFRAQAVTALQGAAQRLAAADRDQPSGSRLEAGLDALMGFEFGAAGERVRAARDAVAALAGGRKPRYLQPQGTPFAPDGLPDIRVHVLGPHRGQAHGFGFAGDDARAVTLALQAGLAATSHPRAAERKGRCCRDSRFCPLPRRARWQ